MATVYSNALNLFNLTSKSSPVGADLVPIGDSAVTGVPLKQATLTSILSLASAGALTKIATVTASASATVNFNNDLTSTYDNYLVIFENVVQATNEQNFSMDVGTGSTPTYSVTSYLSGCSGVDSNDADGGNAIAPGITTTVQLNSPNGTTAMYLSSTSTNCVGGHIEIQNANSASNYKTFFGILCGNFYDATGAALSGGVVTSGGTWQVATVLSSIRFKMSSGNISTGTFKLYGYQN